jgi:hypothetical protein
MIKKKNIVLNIEHRTPNAPRAETFDVQRQCSMSMFPQIYSLNLFISVQIDQRHMLTVLRIKNLALVADLTLELQPGCHYGRNRRGKSG